MLFLLMFSSSQMYGQTYPAAYNRGLKSSQVRYWESKVAQSNAALIIETSSVDSFTMTTQYLDGLGRPLQTVVRQFSPQKKDIVTPVVYDAVGRETYQYLPFIANSTGGNSSLNDGQFKFNPFQQDSSFSKGIYPGESFFYTFRKYETSPFDRTLESYAPGSNWSGTASNSNESLRHGVDMRYGSNTSNDNVQMWKVTDGPVGTFGSYSIVSAYGSGQLSKEIVEDEAGGAIILFKDKGGKVVLRKQLLTGARDTLNGQGHSGYMNTYYIYDTLDNLRCVLQPVGMTTISGTPGWQLNNDTVLNEQCFRYEYDSRGRMIMKKTPGAGKIEMVYDLRDRLIMQRDSSLAKQGYWLINKYDSLNRLVKIALRVNSGSRATHQTAANTDVAFSYPTISANDIMQENYYDNYAWITAPTPQAGIQRTLTTTDITSSFFLTTYNASPDYAQPVSSDTLGVRGMLTGRKIRIFGTSTYLYSVNFYDVKGRLIQTRGGNISSSGYDIVTTQYDFAGRQIRVLHRQEKGNPVARTIRELTKYTYDHMGRVSSVIKKVGPSGLDNIIASNSYDELGRLKVRTLGSNQEIQNYDYNVRGWLLGTNRAYVKGDSVRKFGYDLGYDGAQSVIPAGAYNPDFRGNIGGLTWRSAGDGDQRKYKFTYDAAQRLLKAEFTQYNSTGNVFDNSAGVDFTTIMGNGINGDSAYDVNGNIKKMTQYGLTLKNSRVIDELRYSYLPRSNRLASISDTATSLTAKLGDFTNGTNSGDDYSYDVNGNLAEDKNKGISSILYTHLNTPYEIRIPGKGMITYVYDNLGTKWKKIVVDSTTTPTPTTTTWLYMQNFLYKNDTLQLFSYEDGRVRYDTTQNTAEATAFDFDYFLKDHLGNVRMVLTSAKDTLAYPPATIEPATRTLESKYYDIKTAQVKLTNTITGAPASFSANCYKVNGGVGGQMTGLGIVLKVMAGDKVGIMAESFYSIGSGSGPSGTIPLTELLGAFIASTPMAGKSLATTDVSGIGSNAGLLNALTPSSVPTTIANAHLCWVLFDEQLKVVGTGVDQVKDGGGYKAHIPSTISINKSGYIYVFVTNKSNLDVYFDNLAVTHYTGPILDETHYYPFGLTMAGISSKALNVGIPENKSKFQSQELNSKEFKDGSGLEMYEFKFRMQDPQTGRFWQGDPLTHDYRYNSPYAFSENRVIDGRDLEGLEYVSINHYADGTNGIKMYYKSTDKEINKRGGTTADLYYSASYGPLGRGVIHYYYDNDGNLIEKATRWEQRQTGGNSDWEFHGLYSGPGSITDRDNNYDFSFQPIDWADAIAKRHDMDYVEATKKGEPYAGYLEDVRTVQADRDMIKRVVNLLLDIEFLRKKGVDGVEKPYRTSFSAEMKLALEGQFTVISALATYKQWKIDKGYGNKNTYKDLREEFSKDYLIAAHVLDEIINQ